jgi:hypothetical protein
MSYAEQHLRETNEIVQKLDPAVLEKMVATLVEVKARGYTATVADACAIIPTVNPANVTPHSEAFQAVVWHLLVSHPALKVQQTKWESVK